MDGAISLEQQLGKISLGMGPLEHQLGKISLGTLEQPRLRTEEGQPRAAALELLQHRSKSLEDSKHTKVVAEQPHPEE